MLHNWDPTLEFWVSTTNQHHHAAAAFLRGEALKESFEQANGWAAADCLEEGDKKTCKVMGSIVINRSIAATTARKHTLNSVGAIDMTCFAACSIELAALSFR